MGPHPGPTKAITANAQGAQNSWRLANLVIANHIRVAALVETKFSIQKFADFATFCHKNGFQVFAANHPTIARADDRTYCSGGVVIMVHKSLKAKPVKSWSSAEGDACCVDLEFDFLTGIYKPPEANHHALIDAILECQLFTRQGAP